MKSTLPACSLWLKLVYFFMCIRKLKLAMINSHERMAFRSKIVEVNIIKISIDQELNFVL